jgi:hypothetical protein
VEALANPRITELRTAERDETARRRHRVQKTAAIIAACTVGFVGVGFGGLLVHAHFADQRQVSDIKIVKVKTVPIVADASAAEIVAAAKPAAAAGDTTARVESDAAKIDEVALPGDQVALSADAPDIADLEATDPRWARGADGAAVMSGTSGAAGALTALAPVEQADAAAAVIREEEDGVETAAIAPDEVKPKPVEKKKPAPADVTSDASPQRMATATSDVRLRAGRSAGSAVLGVVPKGAEVGVVSCDGWCEVVFAGKRGFVYKSYVSGSKLTIVRKNSAKDDAEPANPAPSDTQPTIGRAAANRDSFQVGP